MSSPALLPADGARLLAIARQAVRAHLEEGPPPALPAEGPLAERRGAFVTVHVGAALRGCIGTFAPEEALAGTVARMAVLAASQDPRFRPLRREELEGATFHVSVLGPRRRMQDPKEVEVGRDGILVQLGWRRGTLLPRVAVEEGWDAVTFLERTCLKAGLAPGAWRAPEAVVELFSAEELGEAPGLPPPGEGQGPGSAPPPGGERP